MSAPGAPSARSGVAGHPASSERVELFQWNPLRRPPGRFHRRWRKARPLNNFGDLLGPLVVRAVAARAGLDLTRPTRSVTLMSIGSAIHLAPPGAVVWGSGVNGKMPTEDPRLNTLDIRAVRGPRTREHLLARGVDVPPVFGDPAILLGELRPDLVGRPERHGITVIPNLNDVATHEPPFLDPRSALEEVLVRIAESELVVGSSLHGLIVAEALGVPARLVRSKSESPFKYDDYYGGTGRETHTPAADVAEAIRMGGEEPPVFATSELLAAFPFELWHPREEA
jgi:pyruvyltransferase